MKKKLAVTLVVGLLVTGAFVGISKPAHAHFYMLGCYAAQTC